MIEKLADYIVSPLAMGTHDNYLAVNAGRTCLRQYDGSRLGVKEPFVASLVDDATLERECRLDGIGDGYTRFERMALLAACRALKGFSFDPTTDRTVFILSTTKGNIDSLGSDSQRALLTETARRIAEFFGNQTCPVAVSNACVSGMSAQLLAASLLETRLYDYAVVIGADEVTRFTVSGFQSLKATSMEPCRPFDEDRTGLNFGEAAACVVYGYTAAPTGRWALVDGATRNDAYHLSSPSRQAVGAYEALRSLATRNDLADIAFVNVHGTATLFNDEMEATALTRMGWNDKPIFALKGIYGHTMGAAGVLETLIAMEAADDHTVPATQGFATLGVSRAVNISANNRDCGGKRFVKMMSGFGGVNVAALFSRTAGTKTPLQPQALQRRHTVEIGSDGTVTVDGGSRHCRQSGHEMLKALYHECVGNYPKFYKMDVAARLGFIATELLLQAEGGDAPRDERSDRMVVVAARSGSVDADRAFQATIDGDDSFPSPSAFVYTLPNIGVGEIAIRNGYHGATLYVGLPSEDGLDRLIGGIAAVDDCGSVVYGWVDAETEDKFKAHLTLSDVEKR